MRSRTLAVGRVQSVLVARSGEDLESRMTDALGGSFGSFESWGAIVNFMELMEMKMEVVGSVGGDLLVMHA